MRQKMIDGLMAVDVPACCLEQKFLYGKKLEISTSMEYKLISLGYELIYYGTKVARVEVGRDGRKQVRLFGGYSATTMRHVNAWLQWHGMNPITKKQWMKMEVAR